MKEGGGTFRARFGVERNGQTLLAEGSYSVGSEIKDGYPGVHPRRAQEARLGQGPHRAGDGRSSQRVGGDDIDTVSWSTDLSGGIQRVAIEHGCLPYGNAKARAIAWNLPDPVPVHREPIYTPRPDLVADVPDRGRMAGVPRAPIGAYPALQNAAVRCRISGFRADALPARFLTSPGRLVEYEGGGEETRSNPWLAELQQDMFVEINPADAAARGIETADGSG